MRVSSLIPAATAVLLVACGGAAKAATSTSHASPTAAARGGFGGNVVSGKLTQLTSTQLVLAAQTGDVTVTYDSSTRVQRTAAASVSRAVTGTCVNVTGQKDASGLVTAATLNLMLDMKGACTQPSAGPGAGNGGAPVRGAGRPSGAPANLAFVRGKITAAQGPALTVLDISGAPTAVNVSDSTRITSTESATTGLLAVGQCILTTGQRDASGVVAARQLSIVDPGPNGCPTGGQGGGRQGGGQTASG